MLEAEQYFMCIVIGVKLTLNHMKKISYLLMLLMALTFNLNLAHATTKDKPKTELTAEQRAELNRIISRVDEIKAMDKNQS
ncbi:hypothetical protein MASR2M52_05520 [Pedobacter sp.]